MPSGSGLIQQWAGQANSSTYLLASSLGRVSVKPDMVVTTLTYPSPKRFLIVRSCLSSGKMVLPRKPT